MFWKFKLSSLFSSSSGDTSPCLPKTPVCETEQNFGSAFTSVAIDAVLAKSQHDDSVNSETDKNETQNAPRSPLSNLNPCWIIITCLKTRAIHLELASPGDNQSITAAFCRFIKMWSPPEEVTFLDPTKSNSHQNPEHETGSEHPDDHSRERLEAVLPMLQAVNGFKLVKNPKQPVWLNFYFTFISTLRYALRESFRSHPFTKETVNHAHLKQIEDLVNSRPLLKHGNSWKSVLTPEHLVTGNPFAVYKPVLVKKLDSSSTKLTLVTTFWSLWSLQYIRSLREFFQLQGYTPTVGEVVLLLRPTNNNNIVDNNNDHQGKNTPFVMAAVEQIFSVKNEFNFSSPRSSALVGLEDGTTVIAQLQNLIPFECTSQNVQLVNNFMMNNPYYN